MIQLKRQANLTFTVTDGHHTILTDVSEKEGGNDQGIDPHHLLEASLAACTGITLQMYANRKQWQLEGADVEVKILSEGEETVISRKIKLNGALDADQRQRLLEIANRCPLHRILTRPITIQTDLENPA